MPPGLRGSVFAIALLTGALIVVAVQWSWGVPLTNDGPVYLFSAVVHNHFDDARYGFAEHYTLNQPATENGPSQLIGALEPGLGPLAAMRAAFALITLLVFAATFLLSLAIGTLRAERTTPLGVVLALAAAVCMPFQRSLYLGFLPYLLGLAPALGALAVVLRAQHAAHYLAAGALFALAAWIHPVPTGLCGLAAGLVCLSSAAAARRLGLLAIACVPALLLLLRSLDTASDLARADAVESRFAPLFERTALLLGNFWPAPAWLLTLALALAVIGLLSGARALDGRARALAAFALLLLIASMLMPEHLLNWQAANGRLLPVAIPIAFGLLAHASPRLRAALTALAVLFAIATLLDATLRHRALRASAAEALAGLDAAQPTPLSLVEIVTRPHGTDQQNLDAVPHLMEPMARLSAVWASALGGRPFWMLASAPTIHRILLRKDAPRPPFPIGRADEVPDEPAARKGALRILASSAAAFGGVFAFGEAGDALTFDEAGFTRVAGEGPVYVGRFVGCRGRARLVAARARSVEVSWGWWPRRTPWSAPLQLEVSDAGAELELGVLGCGEMWLNVAGAACAEGNPARAFFVPGGDNLLRCTIVEP